MNNEKDSIKTFYKRITPVFFMISKLIESKSRIKSLELSGMKNGSSILILAPPTEYFIDSLLDFNSEGVNNLLYFTDRMKRKAETRFRGKSASIQFGESFNALPYESNTLDMVFAYCFLDALEGKDLIVAIEEIKRILKEGGKLLATYPEYPRNFIEKICMLAFKVFKFLFREVKTGLIESALKQTDFKNIKITICTQKGIPVGLAYAEK